MTKFWCLWHGLNVVARHYGRKILDVDDQNSQNGHQDLKIVTNTFRLQIHHQYRCSLIRFELYLKIFYSENKKVFDAFFRADHTISRPIARRRLCSPIRFVTDPFQDCGPLPVIRHQYIHTTFYNHNLTPKVCMKHNNKIRVKLNFRSVYHAKVIQGR